MRLMGFPIIVAMSALRREGERATQRALRELDLEVVVATADGVRHRCLGGGPVRGHGGRLADEHALGRERAPRLVRDAAKRNSRRLDGFLLRLDDDGYGDKRERIGSTIAHLAI